MVIINLLFVGVLFLNINTSSEQECYAFGYAASLTTKTYYVSNLISVEKGTYWRGIENEWREIFESEIGEADGIAFNSIRVWTAGCNCKVISKKRRSEIAEYKSKGYQILEVRFTYYGD